MKDYYQVLGVSRRANTAEIKDAYRRLIKACHPDINSSPRAAEWTRELNEAYGALADDEARAAHDLELQAEKGKTRTRADERAKASPNPRRSENRPVEEPYLYCEVCYQRDSTLRVSTFWRIFSFITGSKKYPTSRILCQRCRLHESLAASAFTGLFGWWNVAGFVWTVEALGENARGGSQSRAENAALLRTLGEQLQRTGRLTDAYHALLAAFKLKPETATRAALDNLRPQIQPIVKEPIWRQFLHLEMAPVYYHVSAGAMVVILLVLGFDTSQANAPGPRTPGSLRARVRTERRPQNSNDPVTVSVQAPPDFSEPEWPMPELGLLEAGNRLTSYKGVTAPLKISTQAFDGSHVVKLLDWTTGENVATYFLGPGATLEAEVPLGSYRLKFASGGKWYGPRHLFGPATEYCQVPEKMDFRISGDYAEGRLIELISQDGGNLPTPRIRADQW